MPELTFEKKNILVTGGAGFIGSHLCERLLRDGNRVICVDNFATSNVRNIDNLLPNPQFQFLRLDVNQPFDLETFGELAAFKIPFQGIQEIYHLACPTSIKNFDQFKVQTLLSNSLGNYHVLEIARKYRSAALLASSSVVYGERKGGNPFVVETDIGCSDTLSPRANYDEGKRFSETMFETYAQVHGLETKIARIFRTYGPHMPPFDGQLIPDFILNAVDNRDLIIYNGDFKSSLMYVTDAVDALLRLMRAPKTVGPVNIGSDEDLQMSDVAKKIIQMTGSSSKIVAGPDLLFLSELPLPRITKAKEELGWLPLVRLEEGLKKTVEYIRANKLLLTNL